MQLTVLTSGYWLAGAAFAALSIGLLSRWRRRVYSHWVALATLASATWASFLALIGAGYAERPFAVLLIEAAHNGIWLLALAILLGGALGKKSHRPLRFAGVILSLVWLGVGTGSYLSAPIADDPLVMTVVLEVGGILTSLLVLIGLEQIYRNSRRSRRSGLKFFCIAVGTLFSYDLLLYSQAFLSTGLDPSLWTARGYVAGLCVPLIAIAAQRSPGSQRGIMVSRHIVFYTATMIAALAYIAIILVAANYARLTGGDWGPALQVTLIAAGIITLSVFLISDRTRARLRVFIAKHFFQSKYDYRIEWLRLTESLSSPSDTLPLQKRAIRALAQVVNASSGLLWLQAPDDGDYHCVAGWNASPAVADISQDSSLVLFLKKTGWVIDLDDCDENPEKYRDLDRSGSWSAAVGDSLIVPLQHDTHILGFITVDKPQGLESLNFEDHDLLKTTGKQIASYLAQEIATEQLAESRQFEAFNKLTAYLMHDLKNVMAQQSLVVENAQKHKGNPEFVDDAIDTIRSSVGRLGRVIEHLQQRRQDQPLERVELGRLINQTVAQCSDRKPLPEAVVGAEPVRVRANRDRLSMALYHAVRNAQEATPADGQVTIEVSRNGKQGTVTVRDTGVGMDDEFLRDRLFRPFDSTKGTQGMGIGAYQMRETVRSLGGDIIVRSAPGTGTTITMTFASMD